MKRVPNVPPGATAAPPAPAPKKSRDSVCTIAGFKKEIFSKNGLPRFYSMVRRNPIIMSPPANAKEAFDRQNLLASDDVKGAGDAATGEREEQHEEEQARKKPRLEHGLRNEEEEAVFDIEAFFEGKMPVDAATTSGKQQQAPAFLDAESHNVETLLQKEIHATNLLATRRQETEAANYHHKQLHSLLVTLYEFNHATFHRLPLTETMYLLSRCGRESQGHLFDFHNVQREGFKKEVETRNDAKKQQRRLKKARDAGRDEYYETQLALAESRTQQLIEEQTAEGAQDDAEDDEPPQQQQQEEAHAERFDIDEPEYVFAETREEVEDEDGAVVADPPSESVAAEAE